MPILLMMKFDGYNKYRTASTEEERDSGIIMRDSHKKKAESPLKPPVNYG